jgi:hypothetical protein
LSSGLVDVSPEDEVLVPRLLPRWDKWEDTPVQGDMLISGTVVWTIIVIGERVNR